MRTALVQRARDGDEDAFTLLDGRDYADTPQNAVDELHSIMSSATFEWDPESRSPLRLGLATYHPPRRTPLFE